MDTYFFEELGKATGCIGIIIEQGAIDSYANFEPVGKLKGSVQQKNAECVPRGMQWSSIKLPQDLVIKFS